MPSGGIRPGLGPQSSMIPTQMAAGAAVAGAPGFPDVDMSHLSAEERMLIEGVMAKAHQQLDETEERKKTMRSVTVARQDIFFLHILLIF